jgi:hypothetical protein
MEATTMKRIIILCLSLVTLICLGFIFGVQSLSADFNPHIKIEKLGNWDPDTNTIIYTYTVTNTGSATLNTISINDLTSKGKIVEPIIIKYKSNGVIYTGGNLNGGDILEGTASYTPDAADYGDCKVTNNATVTAHYLTNTLTAHSGDITVDIPCAGPYVTPELPAGLLFGLGLTGVCGFIFVRKRQKVIAK